MGTLGRAVTWSLGLWRLASGRIREDWRFLLGVWLLLACATTLLASGVMYGDAVAVGSLRSAIRAVPLVQQSVLVETRLPAAQVGQADARVRSALHAGLGPSGGEVMLEARSGSLQTIAGGATGDGATAAAGRSKGILTYLESATGADGHATLVDGHWPRPGQTPTEAALPQAAARAMGLTLGARVPLADAADPDADPTVPVATVVVVGTYLPQADDPYWGGDPFDTGGAAEVSGASFIGPLLVTQDDLLADDVPGYLDLRWRAIPDLDHLTGDDIEPLRARLDALPDQVRGLAPPGGTLSVSADLNRVLDTVDHSLQVARGAVLLLTLQFAVVAAYAVLLVASMLADRRRPEVGLLRSRGASSAHVIALAFGEAILLTLPAMLVAPAAAAGLTELVGRFGRLAARGAVAGVSISPTVVAALIVTGVLCVVALTLPALAAGAEVAGIRAVLGRPVARTLAQRLGLDVALVVVAGIAIWQLRSYGAPLTRTVRGTLGLDPLLLAAPTVGLLAGAVLATRLVPRLGEVGERLLGHGRGLVSALGARQVARRPLRFTRAVLLLMLSTALGTFAASYAASWSDSQAAQAAYQAGADVRVESAPSTTLPAEDMGTVYRGVPGVTAAMPVQVQDVSVGQVVRSAPVLALDAATAPQVVNLPPGSPGSAIRRGLADLAQAQPAPAGLSMPAGSRRLRVDYGASLTEAPIPVGPDQTLTLPPFWHGVTITAVVQDRDGRVDEFGSSGTIIGLFQAADQSVVIDLPGPSPALPGSGPAEPLTLLALDVSLSNPFSFAANPITGTLTVTGLATAPASGQTWTALGGATALDPWIWEASTGGGFQLLIHGARLVLGPDSTEGSQNGAEVRLRAPLQVPTPFPVLASQAFLAATASTVGQTITGRLAGSSTEMRIVGAYSLFPTLDPALPSLVVDGPTLADAAFLQAGSPSLRGDWWLATRPGAELQVAQALGAPSLSQNVVSRDGLLDTLADDPVGLGTLGALLLGSLAAAAFAVVGFLVGASVSTRERVGEFALLRALGLSGRQLTLWLAAEHAFLLLVGLGAGIAIGLLLAWLVVPAVLLSATGRPIVPTPVVVVPWPLIALVAAAALTLLIVTVLAVGRPLPRRRIASVLREAGG
ncbi:MAG TPA: ABC transporter permease [Candidatus Limnocylindrales bacterium]|nr:ABC transporter permease [Candidatus Limnocylindrales bacterium]